MKKVEKEIGTRKKYAELEHAKESLSKEDARRLDELHEDLEGIKEVYYDVAEFCLNLARATPRDEGSIHRTAHILTEFIWWKFGPPLDEVFHIAKQLEMPEHAIHLDEIFKLWDRMILILEQYVSSSE